MAARLAAAAAVFGVAASASLFVAQHAANNAFNFGASVPRTRLAADQHHDRVPQSGAKRAPAGMRSTQGDSSRLRGVASRFILRYLRYAIVGQKSDDCPAVSGK